MPEILGKQVGGIGYGLMGLTGFRAVLPSDEEAFKAMRVALETGCNFWNGGVFYGTPERNSLTLLKKYYERYPEDASKVVLNIKGGLHPDFHPDGSPAFLRKEIETALAALGPKGKIDMYEMSRRDPKTPLEVTLKALEELVQEGKIGGVALCEVNAKTIREGAAITKIMAVEIELSLWTTDPLTNGIAEACAELGIPIIAYSPIGRGMLSGQIKSFDDIPDDDFRKTLPRFQPGNFEINLQLVKEVEKIAAKKNCTPAQLAISWLRNLSKRKGMPEIYPIPGAVSVERVKENSTLVELSESEMESIDKILASFEIVGDRYQENAMALVNG